MTAILLLNFLLVSSACFAQDFFKGHSEGWHWYEDREQIGEVENRKQKILPLHSPKPQQKEKPLTPTQIIKAYQQDLEEKLHRAVVTPTPQSLIAYIEAQTRGQKIAQRFADEWMKVIYTHPSLDFTAKAPVNHVGRKIYTAQTEKKRDLKIQNLAKTHGLLFFFEGGCSYCKAFAPVVKRFAEKYSFKILAISMDGASLKDFPEFQKDNGIAARFKLRHVPTVLAVNPRERQVISFAHGFLSEAELEKRLDALSVTIKTSTEKHP